MMHGFKLGGKIYHAALAGKAAVRQLLTPEGAFGVSMRAEADGSWTVRVDDAVFTVFIAGTDAQRFLHIGGEMFEVAVLDPLVVHAHKGVSAGGLVALAPMPGTIVAVPVSVNDIVAMGDTLVVIESMKLEVSIKAERAGRVAAVHFELARSFDKGAVLVTLIDAG